VRGRTGVSRRLRPGDVLVQLGLVATALVVDVLVRWSTLDDVGKAVANARDVLALERSLGLDVERDVQRAVATLPAVDWFLTQLYVWGYLPVVLGALVWAYLTAAREDYLRLRDALLASGAVGMVVYATYPVAPPRMVPGFVDTVTRSSLDAFAHPAGIANEIAAMPSFHVAWLVVIAAVTAPRLRSRTWRVACWAYPALMALAVVSTGNHWVLDVPAGVAVAVVGLVVARRLAAARARARRSH
jgi:hypothetical protein